MTHSDFQIDPQAFWQELEPAGTYERAPRGGHKGFFPAELPDGRQLGLPIRVLSGGERALASLIVNQASFSVSDALAKALAEKASAFRPDVVVGLPTLGLTLASQVARALGHSRYVPLSTSRKFWYEEERSVPLRSVTSPDQQKRLYVDPRMLPLIEGRRVLLVDDVISTGSSILAGLKLLKLCNIEPVAVGAAMLQTRRWREALSAESDGICDRVVGVFETPALAPTPEGGWLPEQPAATE
ncbi:phosphoribosyltransferase [Nitratireductor aquimarinus]|uniref:phosphoribosyltransferase n=1 Tax=Alphaproteobacteria TaxID=28211 RepID=UPI0019D3E911|nr:MULTISPECIES: phosphoribosyltransferase [Alphaproteobacteria]MBY6021466.1 phosphoribosyltransferase [Nitratireductor sp. DP7N14-4]MBN7756943.1 phosphoribosyltransferase [Nitratireductor aquimarinus]MBN8243833.1 phosphoribosyltransferase [Nitratireductor aquimarinus]MBY5999440.1 phosphoribosyltransferase [Tritonibacter mobilis]MBY6131367.1 phosphoribosyltransferase [Nitratireductor aquimarinus]